MPNGIISLNLPSQHRITKEIYEEGIIYYVLLKYGCIIITEGANMSFDIDSFPPTNDAEKDNYLSGINNTCFWRKEQFGRIRVYCRTYNLEPQNIKSLNKTCKSIEYNSTKKK